MPWSPMGPEIRTLSPGRTDAGLISIPGIGAPMPVVEMYMESALPCSTTFVSPPAIRTPASLGGRGHGLNFGLQNFRRQTGFENERHHEDFRFRAGNCQVVHGAVYGQLADRAARKAERLDDEAVGGDRQARAVEIHVGRVAERLGGRAIKQRREETLDQAAAGFSAGAVSHLDLRLAKANLRRSDGRPSASLVKPAR